MPHFALIEFVIEFLIEIILEVVFEILIEVLWFVTRQTGRAGMYAARVSRLVDTVAYTLIAAGAWFWGSHLAAKPDDSFPWSVTWLVVLASSAGAAAMSNVQSPSTWLRLFKFDTPRFTRIASASGLAALAMTAGYVLT